jgi:hypothetical protein
MPVKPGNSKKVISSNIKELHTGKTHARTEAKEGKQAADKQSVAIALSEARKSGTKRTTRPRKARTTR